MTVFVKKSLGEISRGFFIQHDKKNIKNTTLNLSLHRRLTLKPGTRKGSTSIF